MDVLFALLLHQRWPEATDHINELSDADAVDKLFYAVGGITTTMIACLLSAPLELFQLMITTAKLDPRKRNLQALTDSLRRTALHWAGLLAQRRSRALNPRAPVGAVRYRLPR